jgi:glutamine---fructose-6-phosphate transaminase (isomerizing)
VNHHHMYREIRSQADAWTSAVDAVEASREAARSIVGSGTGRDVLFLGAGSSYYLGLSAAVTWGRHGFAARALPSSEQLLHAGAYIRDVPPLVVAISRSGATTETLDAVRALRSAGSPCIAISTDAASEIARSADLVIEVAGGREESIVQTRSFSGQLVAANALAAVACDDGPTIDALRDLPRAYAAWLDRADELAGRLADAFRRAYVLGTGERWGLAMEGALKLKEASLTEAEAFQTFEFRHGPKSMIDAETLVVGLVGRAHQTEELDVLREASALGARVLVIAEEIGPEQGLEVAAFRSGVAEGSAVVYHLPLLHLLAYHRAIARGLDPDHPRHLDFAVLLARP